MKSYGCEKGTCPLFVGADAGAFALDALHRQTEGAVLGGGAGEKADAVARGQLDARGVGAAVVVGLALLRAESARALARLAAESAAAAAGVRGAPVAEVRVVP